jgi:hypothetical protein
MNHREPPHLPAAARRALHCLSLLLLPALAPKGADALPRARSGFGGGAGSTQPRPASYLSVIGAPPLRFQEATPPPDLTTRPAAAAPPQPALTPTENSVAVDNAAAARSIAATPAEPSAPTAPETKPSTKESPASTKQPSAILPDDARPAVRPEDFLPYFQIPGSARKPGDVTLLMPVPSTAPTPAPIPPSSATYTQTK